ncbi:unnamed protein product [Rotaria sp. Silwood2]|nr:unnamed protein product [Rotaria sp. Silwood2]CAF2829626.1 unnamed protein product [Rotaria sp. Silwood2]CAF3282184.1 unnamed protein product [Rotaria sp. Silwood2]
MDNHQSKPNVHDSESEVRDDNLQKPNIYNKYLPFYESIKRHAFESFDEIRENLSRTIQLGELHPSFSIFTRILNRFSLPIGKNHGLQESSPYMMIDVARWLVAMIGNGSSCLQYMRELFMAIKVFYHPSNTGEFQEFLIELILKLAEQFVERVQLLFLSVDNMTEPDRFTLIMKCLPGIVRQIVRQTPTYSEGQTYVLPLLMSVLPGIDSNDFRKKEVTFEVLDAILKLVPCVDCSSTVYKRTDLTEIEKQVCLSTTQFEDFVTDFLNRIFQMISQRSTEISDATVTNNKINWEDETIDIKLISIMSSIVQQCSSKIFQVCTNSNQ